MASDDDLLEGGGGECWDTQSFQVSFLLCVQTTWIVGRTKNDTTKLGGEEVGAQRCYILVVSIATPLLHRVCVYRASGLLVLELPEGRNCLIHVVSSAHHRSRRGMWLTIRVLWVDRMGGCNGLLGAALVMTKKVRGKFGLPRCWVPSICVHRRGDIFMSCSRCLCQPVVLQDASSLTPSVSPNWPAVVFLWYPCQNQCLYPFRLSVPKLASLVKNCHRGTCVERREEKDTDGNKEASRRSWFKWGLTGGKREGRGQRPEFRAHQSGLFHMCCRLFFKNFQKKTVSNVSITDYHPELMGIYSPFVKFPFLDILLSLFLEEDGIFSVRSYLWHCPNDWIPNWWYLRRHHDGGSKPCLNAGRGRRSHPSCPQHWGACGVGGLVWLPELAHASPFQHSLHLGLLWNGMSLNPMLQRWGFFHIPDSSRWDLGKGPLRRNIFQTKCWHLS